MDRRLQTYIAGKGSITSIGPNSDMNFHAVKAGISAYRSADYFTSQRERMNMALIPDEALPPLVDALDVRGKLSFRYRRILRMCQLAATEALNGYSGDPLPLVFAAPADDFGLQERFPDRFIHYLAQQSGLPIDPQNSRLFRTGRSGVLEALDLAARYLHELNMDYVLVGGGDSYQNSELLAALDQHQRILAPGVEDGFVPGEGAGFLLLTCNPNLALRRANLIPCLLPAGLAQDPGHLLSDTPSTGEGLTVAFRQALSFLEGNDQIRTIYASMNGENFWAKEYGAARARNSSLFRADCVLQHPAECFGDIGAASGAVMIDLAVQSILNGEDSSPILIYCSSDHQYRAAVCVEPLLLQQPQSKATANLQYRSTGT